MDLFRFEFSGVDDAGGQQLLRGLGLPGEEFARAVRVMPHGLASHPLAGAHGVGMALMGRRDQIAVIGGERADKRPRDVVAGGSVLYDAAGNIVSCRMGPGVLVRAVDGTVTVERGGMKIIVSEDRVDLGGSGGEAVVTVAGPSSKVFAVL